jgi:hypothetical protein
MDCAAELLNMSKIVPVDVPRFALDVHRDLSVPPGVRQ